MFSLISWNIRGLGSSTKQQQLRDLINKHEAKFVFICETKMQGINNVFCSKIWNIRELEFRSVDAKGLSGGLLLLWDGSKFIFSRSCSNRNWILIEGSFGDSSDKLCICCVYGDRSLERRLAMWNELRSLKASFSSPWLLVGDLNETLSMEDSRSNRIYNRGAGALKSFIDFMHLGEFPLQDCRFTWANSIYSSRIDRAFAQPEWSLRFRFLNLTTG
ncbi:hypothetical protein Tsubulata_016315 [Turnera subulata]|uniref:Endonuclease/exonuclease/phosphatase domain-containing protein n=1 Tax=Turnera subulata TaxID=218843 RepID=A0A9Q0J3H6_9ROSI|nr:hypothetical protein Tsubulata_016315 [Turnera subulata]